MNRIGNTLYSWSKDSCPQKKAAFLVRGGNTHAHKHARLGRFVDMCKHNSDLFKKLVGGMKKGGCVCLVLFDAKKQDGTNGSSRSTFPYFEVMNDMFDHINQSMQGCIFIEVLVEYPHSLAM